MAETSNMPSAGGTPTVSPYQQNRQEAQHFDNEFGGWVDQLEEDEAVQWADDTATPSPAAGETDPSSAEEAATDPRLGVARDISLGVMQAPRSIARGVTEGVREILQIGTDLNRWVDGPVLQIMNEKGEFDPEFFRQSNFDAKFAGGEGPGVEVAVPTVDKPAIETVTGNGIEAISQFMVGFKGVDKAFKGAKVLSKADEALQALGRGGEVASAAVKGALADMAVFDEQEQRLSNVMQQVPALQNPVTEYLAASPDDSFAEGKFKQGIEGLITGPMGDLLVDGVKLLKRAKAAKAKVEVPPAADDAAAAAADQAGPDLSFLGDAARPEMVIEKGKLQQAAEEVRGMFGTRQVGDGPVTQRIDDYTINFARIEGPDDIKQLMDEMVNKPELKPSIEAARRGERNTATTLEAAQDIDGFDQMMTRRVGDAFNAEQIVAARKVYYDTTEKLMDAARRASLPNAGGVDQFNFRKMVAVHHAVQKEFMGIRAEAGRALQAWRIPLAGSGGENMAEITRVLDDFGGAEASKELAERLTRLGPNANTAQINMITQKSALARSGDALTEAWTLGLLTNPTTHVVNLESNVLTGLVLGMERLGAAYPKDSPVTLQEGVAFFQGMLGAQKMALKNAAQAWRTGETGMGLGKIELPRQRATARDILDPEGRAGLAGRAIDAYGWLLQKYAGGMLAVGDEYSKTVLYQAELSALATRNGIAAGMDRDALKQHVASVLADPPASLRAQSVEFAGYGTFTRELGKNGKEVQRFIARNPALKFVVPFVRTPANIFKFTFERTPLAPLSRKIRDDIAAGGVRRATALTRMGTGTSIMMLGSDLALNGQITGGGPADPELQAGLRRTGWQPYSVKVGDTYYSYARMDPLATVLGMSADMAEILSNYEAYDINAQQEADELVTAGVMAISNQVVGKTFMTGFADLMEVLSDPKRYADGWLNRFAGSFVPAGVAAIERAVDPETEQVFNMMDAVRSRIPGMSDAVPPRRNIWGEPINTFTPSEDSVLESGAERLLSLFNPVYYSKEKDAPVDRWMLSNGFSIDMPDKTQVLDGVRVDLREFPEIYDRLVELRGGGVQLQKYANQSMKEFFEGLASEEDPFGRHVSFFQAFGNDYDDQQNFIRQVVRDYTAAAKEQVLEEYVDDLGPLIDRERRRAASLDAVRPSLREMQGGDAQ